MSDLAERCDMAALQEHETVLLHPAVDALVTDCAGFYVDGTFGRGGHSRLILEQLNENGQLLAIDKDPRAIAIGQELSAGDARVCIKHGAFSDVYQWVQSGQLTGSLLDLGVSSPQVADVIYQYGEERFSRRIAKAIVRERELQPITRTLQLAEIVKQANPAWEKHKHPATRAFQAIRIHINQELLSLQELLGKSLQLLRPGGRLVVISFHSLEDRIVKQFIQKQSRGDEFPRDLPVPESALNPRLKKIGKAIKPDAQEVSRNPRARSAVMRVAERMA